jgi:hypothetical protein
VIFFENGSPHEAINDALREGARVRQIIKDHEAEKLAARSAASANQVDGGADQSPRRMRHRSF